MKAEKSKSKVVWFVLCLGMIVSLLSLLENYWPWLAALCNIFGSGCRQAAEFTLFQIPIPIWGMVFYVALALLQVVARTWVFRLVMLGIGAEATLILLMISRDIICIFCLFNAFVIFILLLLFIRIRYSWQCIALCLAAYLASNYLLIRENPPPRSPQAVLAGESVVAQVNGQPITLTDLESGIATKLYKLRQEIYRMKVKHLEDLIHTSLIHKQETFSDDTVAERFREDDGNTDATRKESSRILTDILNNQPDIDQYLEKPPLPYTRINIGKSPDLGPTDAPVTIIEFSDYLCPACKRAHHISNEIRELFKGKIQWIFKDYPLKMHPGADKLAEAARCAADQGKFWEFQDLLFDAEKHPDQEMLERFAQSLSMDVARFDQCLASEKHAAAVDKDKADATQAGVSSTPSFIINGRLHPGSMQLERFKEAVQEALQQSES